MSTSLRSVTSSAGGDGEVDARPEVVVLELDLGRAVRRAGGHRLGVGQAPDPALAVEVDLDVERVRPQLGAQPLEPLALGVGPGAPGGHEVDDGAVAHRVLAPHVLAAELPHGAGVDPGEQAELGRGVVAGQGGQRAQVEARVVGRCRQIDPEPGRVDPEEGVEQAGLQVDDVAVEQDLARARPAPGCRRRPGGGRGRPRASPGAARSRRHPRPSRSTARHRRPGR